VNETLKHFKIFQNKFISFLDGITSEIKKKYYDAGLMAAAGV